MKDLIARTKLFDPMAASYLKLAAANGECSQEHPDTLNAVFTWEEQPQGHTYWNDLDNLVGSVRVAKDRMTNEA